MAFSSTGPRRPAAQALQLVDGVMVAATAAVWQHSRVLVGANSVALDGEAAPLPSAMQAMAAMAAVKSADG